MKRLAVVLLIMSLMTLVVACSKGTQSDVKVSEEPKATKESNATKAPQASETPSTDTNPVTSETPIAVDEKYAVAKEDLVPPTDTLGITMTEEMLKRAIANAGNMYRMTEVMKRAADGEEITIAYIGGSITNGSSAVPQNENCYANLSYQWWVQSFPNAKINYVNAGIGATDSYLGVHRVHNDVLSKNPDVVIIEFSVNDYRPHNADTYESLILELLNYQTNPAVVPLFITQQNGSDFQFDHQVIAFNYELPMLSYRNLILPELESGNIKWTDIANESDGTHPANGGHAIIAHILTSYFNQVRMQLATPKHTSYEVTSKRVNTYVYENGAILDHTTTEPSKADGFDKIEKPNAQFTNGWETTTGGSITFEVEAKSLGVIFYGTVDGKSGAYDVYVDGEKLTTIDSNFTGQWGSHADYVELLRGEETKTHQIEFKKADQSTGDLFAILGLTVTK